MPVDSLAKVGLEMCQQVNFSHTRWLPVLSKLQRNPSNKISYKICSTNYIAGTLNQAHLGRAIAAGGSIMCAHRVASAPIHPPAIRRSL